MHLYPKPKHDAIIEPFAGSARYALKYFEKDVTLIDKYEVVVNIWRYLQQSSIADIVGLPDVSETESLNDIRFNGLSAPEKDLIGFHLRRGGARPGRSTGDRCDWKNDKLRIANNLFKIRHWKILLGEYTQIENKQATWFVDPPYTVQKHRYNFAIVDYPQLRLWCENRIGQVIICGNTDDTWMPFKKLTSMNGTNKQTTEVFWTNETLEYQSELFT